MNVSLFEHMRMFTHRTRPQQMSSNLGTALRQWQLSHHPAPADKNRIESSCTVKPGTLPPQTLLTHPRETSRLKCEETHTHKKDTRINGTRFTKRRIYKRIIHLFTRIDHKKKKKKDLYIFTRTLWVNEHGARRVYGRIFNKLFLKCLDFTLERILFHTFGNLEKNISAPSFFIEIKKKKAPYSCFATHDRLRRVLFHLYVLSFLINDSVLGGERGGLTRFINRIRNQISFELVIFI